MVGTEEARLGKLGQSVRGTVGLGVILGLRGEPGVGIPCGPFDHLFLTPRWVLCGRA